MRMFCEENTLVVKYVLMNIHTIKVYINDADFIVLLDFLSKETSLITHK